MEDLDIRMMKRDAVAVWKRGPLDRPVLVAPAAGAASPWCRGRFTQRKYVVGRTLPEVERILGLPPGALAAGADVYDMPRAPQVDEFDVEAEGGRVPKWRVAQRAFVPARRVGRVKPGGTLV